MNNERKLELIKQYISADETIFRKITIITILNMCLSDRKIDTGDFEDVKALIEDSDGVCKFDSLAAYQEYRAGIL